MAVLTAIETADARALMADYGLGELGSLEGIPAGSVNSNFALVAGDRRLFLRVYEERDFAGAHSEAAMLERLSAAGVPTPAPLRRRDGELISTVRAKPAAVFPWRDGSMRCQASVSPRDAWLIGAALARVHLAGVT